MKSKIKTTLTLLILFSSIFGSFAQTYYPMQEDPFQGPPLQGILGTLYNPFPYIILNANTLYHGTTNLYGTIYLVNPIEEYDFIHPLVPLSPYYTSALALCSIKAPPLKLYAPIEVASVSADPDNGLLNKYYPFAAPVSTLTYNGPFDKMDTLNKVPVNFKHPVNSNIAVSILEATQKFIAMTHDFYQWDGFDKAGNVCITTLVDKNFEVTRFDYQDTLIYHQSSIYTPSSASRDLVAHEVSHGIIQQIPTLGNPAYEGYASNPIPLHALMEGFCDILGLACRNYYELENGSGFEAPIWAYGNLQGNISPPNSSLRRFNKPKSTLSPKAYKGKYFYDLNHPDYTPQSNGMVFDFWFYLLASGEVQEGEVDDNEQLGSYKIYPLDPDSKFNCYKLALDVVFKTFTSGKITLGSNYPDARKQTLKTLEELGYPIGSHVYQQFVNAWYAVGVGEKWNPVNNPDCSIVSTGETWTNGIVTFNSQQTTIETDPQSPKVILLNDCTTLPNVQTKQYDLITGKNDVCIDADLDKIYSPENNTDISKSAVSVHKFMSVARDWYKNHFDHIGPDGNGSVTITSILGSPYIDGTSAFKSSDSTFYFTGNPSDCNRDNISNHYFNAIRYFKDGNAGIANNNSNPDWEIINAGLSQIFSLEIKKDYEKLHQNSNADDIWTLNEEYPDPQSNIKDFTNPKLYGQPAVYNGEFWSYEKPENNAAIFRKLYHLLIAGADQYSVDEFPEFEYTIFPQNKNLVLKVLWNAYETASPTSTVEEFRAITLKVLHDLMPGDFINAKPKEYIAFYDAWAAVLGLPDYASTLKHTPDEGDSEYPWTVKVGTEVEYPLYESERLFEVSKSPTFNDSEAPVYQFVSSAAPSQTSSMAYGYVNLEPNQTYYIHSRLSKSGDPRLGCPVTDDPVFCEQLQSKVKWTTTYDFKTDNVKAVSNLIPQSGAEIPAWKSPISWKVVKGADGYDLNITDLSGKVTPQTVAHESLFDPDNAQEVINKTLALSKNTSYNWTVTSRRRLGSEWAVHVLADGKTLPFQEEEKEALPYAYGTVSALESFKTDTPKIKLAQPADGQHVSMLGYLKLTAELNDRADKYFHRFYFNGDQDDAMDVVDSRDKPFSDFWINGLKLLEDQHVYAWTFAPMHSAVMPFIPQDETGEVPPRFHFVVDKNLIGKPVLEDAGCIPSGGQIHPNWGGVPGATGYHYSILNLLTSTEIASGIVEGDPQGPVISGAKEYPGDYMRKVSAGVKDANGNWVFGPETLAGYRTNPPPLTTPSPSAQTVPFGNNNSINFTWLDPTNTGSYLFTLDKMNTNGLDNVVTNMEVGSLGATVPNLEFDKDYQWGARIKSSYGCLGPTVTSQFHTEKEPIKVVPELMFEYTILVKDDLDLPLTNALTYNLTIYAPNGDKVFNQMGISDLVPVTASLPIMNGTYKVNVLVSWIADWVGDLKHKPAYTFKLISWDNGPANQQLDSDIQFGEFNPVQNVQIHTPFEYSTSNNNISH